jgi:hypothetical protein
MNEIMNLLISEIKKVLQSTRHSVVLQVNDELLVEFNRHCLAN